MNNTLETRGICDIILIIRELFECGAFSVWSLECGAFSVWSVECGVKGRYAPGFVMLRVVWTGLFPRFMFLFIFGVIIYSVGNSLDCSAD